MSYTKGAPDVLLSRVREAHEAIERDLVYVGVVGMIDPARPEAAAAIAEAHAAGVRTIMIFNCFNSRSERSSALWADELKKAVVRVRRAR